MLAANFRNSLNVTFRRRDCAQGGSHDWLENKRRHIFRALAFQHAPEFVRALHVAFRITKPVRTPVTIARRNVSPLRQHTRERLAPPDVSGNRQSPQRAPVITLQAGNHAESFFLPAFYPVLPRQLQRSFRGLRPARSKINSAALPHSLRSERENSLCKLFGDGSVKLRRMNVSKLRRLIRYRAGNLCNAVPDG